MRKIRIAQIGTSINSHGEAIRKSLCKQNDLFEFVGYALPENEREKVPAQAAKFEGLRSRDVPRDSKRRLCRSPRRSL